MTSNYAMQLLNFRMVDRRESPSVLCSLTELLHTHVHAMPYLFLDMHC